MNKEQINTLASDVVFNAYQMFSSEPSATQDKPYPMYSFDRPASLFWFGVAKTLAESGCGYDQIQEFLRSKNARWMLDQFEEELENLGKELAKKYLEE